MGMLLHRHYEESKKKEIDFNALELTELKVIAKEKGISIPAKAKKTDVIALLKGDNNGTNG
ncbi:hypothetical protein [Megasphaera vaginalis (ex Bordigoni et al. 2020)]|uniref:hypothetical protein n=1 Tax=Megasphaera vaginalis (ex Bordigoni et al. 2020) TaxID=2045301 RepID=UPI000C7A8304|nr:hypothetical protein [Megasphaera vaginalis (ex Bordigoni et al. 2020)]